SVNVLEAVRRCSSVRAVVNIAKDKCYENREQAMGYIETDPMGGYDPYSASKGCVELVVSSYRRSFFNIDKYGKEHNVLLASCRAGNVIGGGDWAEDRLIPDVVRAASKNEPVFIRSPHATRPWQHVLEPLSGYLLIGQKLLEGDKAVSDVWNLGPDKKSNISVEKVLYRAMKCWDAIGVRIDESHHPHEAGLLMLDCTRAKTKLNWNGVWAVDKTIAKTINWYKQYYLNKKVLSITDLNEYILDAKNKKLVWAA
ncbi:MAG: CDP-glucose 4,6-dehydratase, partial [Candidatus Omnitrophica bacterium]|nr:CDP-glucose 4,6-dehydratase [Candidatus Omnitrophota bacterium]